MLTMSLVASEGGNVTVNNTDTNNVNKIYKKTLTVMI